MKYVTYASASAATSTTMLNNLLHRTRTGALARGRACIRPRIRAPSGARARAHSCTYTRLRAGTRGHSRD
jgi:hypothetical protein